jgi:hypothetical protein
LLAKEIMARIRTVLLAMVVFAFGVTAGGWAVFWALNEFMLHPISISTPSSEAMNNMAALRALREGKSENAIAILENGLDANVIALGHFPKERFGKETISIIDRIVEYRQQYPFTSSEPTVAAHVASVLSKFKDSTRKTQ